MFLFPSSWASPELREPLEGRRFGCSWDWNIGSNVVVVVESGNLVKTRRRRDSLLVVMDGCSRLHQSKSFQGKRFFIRLTARFLKFCTFFTAKYGSDPKILQICKMRTSPSLRGSIGSFKLSQNSFNFEPDNLRIRNNMWYVVRAADQQNVLDNKPDQSDQTERRRDQRSELGFLKTFSGK